MEIDKIGSDGFLGLALWLLSTRSVVVVDLLVGFFVVDEIGVVGFFSSFSFSIGGSCSGYFLWFLVVIFGSFFFFLLLVVFVVVVSCGGCCFWWVWRFF